MEILSLEYLFNLKKPLPFPSLKRKRGCNEGIVDKNMEYLAVFLSCLANKSFGRCICSHKF